MGITEMGRTQLDGSISSITIHCFTDDLDFQIFDFHFSREGNL